MASETNDGQPKGSSEIPRHISLITSKITDSLNLKLNNSLDTPEEVFNKWNKKSIEVNNLFLEIFENEQASQNDDLLDSLRLRMYEEINVIQDNLNKNFVAYLEAVYFLKNKLIKKNNYIIKVYNPNVFGHVRVKYNNNFYGIVDLFTGESILEQEDQEGFIDALDPTDDGYVVLSYDAKYSIFNLITKEELICGYDGIIGQPNSLGQAIGLFKKNDKSFYYLIDLKTKEVILDGEDYSHMSDLNNRGQLIVNNSKGSEMLLSTKPNYYSIISSTDIGLNCKGLHSLNDYGMVVSSKDGKSIIFNCFTGDESCLSDEFEDYFIIDISNLYGVAQSIKKSIIFDLHTSKIILNVSDIYPGYFFMRWEYSGRQVVLKNERDDIIFVNICDGKLWDIG